VNDRVTVRGITLPVTGTMDPGTEEFETAVLELLAERNVVAAQLCVSKGGRIVLNRAYGYIDPWKKTPLPVNARFRLASVDKIVTGTAVGQLCAAHAPLPLPKQSKKRYEMGLGLRPFQYFRELGVGPVPGVSPDPRLYDITVEHLLEHQAGLDQSVHSFTTLREAFGLQRLPVPADAIRYHFSRPLSFDPGSKSQYDSAGYWVLRILVGLAQQQADPSQKNLGPAFINYLKKNVFGPAGTDDLCLSHIRFPERERKEVRYCVKKGGSDEDGVFVDLGADGDYNDHHLILATSAEAMVRYLCYWYLGGEKRLWTTDPAHLAPGLNNGGGSFFGGMEGIETMINQRRWDMVNWCLLMNNTGGSVAGAKPQDTNRRLEAVCQKLGW